MTSARLEELTWTCHVCGDERPDATIAVYTRQLRNRRTGVEMRENIRYCRDRASCVAGAPLVRWVTSDAWEELAR